MKNTAGLLGLIALTFATQGQGVPPDTSPGIGSGPGLGTPTGHSGIGGGGGGGTASPN